MIAIPHLDHLLPRSITNDAAEMAPAPTERRRSFECLLLGMAHASPADSARLQRGLLGECQIRGDAGSKPA